MVTRQKSKKFSSIVMKFYWNIQEFLRNNIHLYMVYKRYGFILFSHSEPLFSAATRCMFTFDIKIGTSLYLNIDMQHESWWDFIIDKYTVYYWIPRTFWSNVTFAIDLIIHSIGFHRFANVNLNCCCYGISDNTGVPLPALEIRTPQSPNAQFILPTPAPSGCEMWGVTPPPIFFKHWGFSR